MCGRSLLSLGYSPREIALQPQKSIDNQKYSNLEELFKQVLVFSGQKIGRSIVDGR